MTKIIKIALLTLIMTLVNFPVEAQEKSSVLITLIKSGRDITLQVVKSDNSISTEKYRFKKNEPDEMILKREMDQWLNKGYFLSNTYVYNLPTQFPGNTPVNTTYVNYVLISKVSEMD